MRLLAPALLSLLCAARAALGSSAEPLEEHVAHIGVPLVDSAAHAAQWRTPRFHRIQPAVAPAPGTKSKTAVYVATQQGAVGALNPRNGEIVWRRVLNHTDEVQGFWTGMDVALYLTGPGATRASLHHALTGDVLWSAPLSFPASLADAVVPEFAHPGCDAAFVQDRVLLLDGARRVRRVAGYKGVEEWRWDVRESAPHASLVRLAPSPAHDALWALSLTPHTSLLSSSPSSYTLSSHTLNPQTGELIGTKELGHVSPPRELEGWRGEGKAGGAKDVVVLPLGPTSPASPAKPTGLEPHALHIATDGTLHASSLVSASTHTLKARVGKFVALREVGMGEKGIAVALRDDGHADVVRVVRSAKGDVQLKAVWEFEEDAKDAVYSGAYDKQGNAYINRVFFSPNQHLLNFHVYWVDANDGEGQVTGYSFQWDHDLHGDVLAAPFEVSPVSPFQLVTRAVLATSSGSLRMIQEDRHQWILEEGTTVPVAAVLVDLPERQLSRNVTTVEERRAAAAVRAVLEGERFPDRLGRHLVALRRAPAWSVQLAKGMVSSVLEFSFDPRIIVPKAPQVKSKASGVAPRATPVATVPKSKAPAGGVQAAEIPAQPKVVPQVGNRRQQTRTTAVPEGPLPPSSLAPRYANASDVAQLHRDKMGFRKVLVSVSKFGKVYAKDTQTGHYLWEKSLVGFGTGEGKAPPEIKVRLLSVTRPVGAAVTASGTAAGDSEAAAAAALGPLVTIAAEVLEKGHWVLRIWEINPLTGHFLYGEETQTGAPLLLGTAKDVFVLPVEGAETGQKALGAVDAEGALRIWPESPSVLRAFAQIAPSFFFSSVSDEGKRLTGYAVLSGSSAQTVPVWQLPLADGEVVESVSRATSDVVASQGKVLGTRETMYKYLSPHALLVVTREAAARSATVYVVDGVAGNVLYSSRIADGNLTPDSELLATFTENWVAVTYTVAAEASSDAAASELDAPSPKSSKPETRLLSLELYEEESRSLQTWKWSGQRSSFAHDGHAASPAAVRAFAQTYVVPFAVRALGHTRTRYGVTVKALLLATSNGSLFALPRRMLDPRRPVGRKATTTELEEGLATFDAYIPNDPRLDVGGEYRIEGAKLIVTASAMLESSSVVYVAGLDELLTRVAPSGTFDMLSPTFNKAQLLLTIAALSGGLIIVRPMVKAKVLKARW